MTSIFMIVWLIMAIGFIALEIYLVYRVAKFFKEWRNNS